MWGPPVSDVRWKRDFKRIFALIIGIDFYDPNEGFKRLESAVSDAKAYKAYLTDYLSVPDTQIQMLIGETASREAILDSFASFKKDERIKVGDAIFIVYAGHGCQIEAPSGWAPGVEKFIQGIVPQNYCSQKGLEVPFIPDRIIGALLEDIAAVKGDNITIVLDCCHSASGTRGRNNKMGIRSVTLKPINTKDLDIYEQYYKALDSAPRFHKKGLTTHVLIAACSSSGVAEESTTHGKFSGVFLKLLRSTPPDQLQYSQIPKLIDPIDGQHPQVEGVNQDRFFFGVTSSTHIPAVHHALLFDKVSKSYFIKAGTAHGVTHGSTFDVFSKIGSTTAAPIATLVVEKSMPFHSHVKPGGYHPEFPSNLDSVVVVPKYSGKQPHPLRLYISRNHRYQASLKYIASLIEDSKHNLRNIILVDHPDDAHLEVSVSRNKAMFQLIDKRAKQHGFHHRFPRIDALNDKTASFLEDASNFWWELDRTSDDDTELMDDIEVSFYPLEEVPVSFTDSDTRMELMPVSEHDFCEDDEIDIVVKHDLHFGVKITNNSDRALYPSLVYFDCSDLSAPVTRFNVNTSGPYILDAPLKADGGCLTIGYGSGGMPPLTFNLQEGQDVAVGFLKLFVFTRPLDSNTKLDHHNLSADTWGSRVIPIIQRRRPKQSPVMTTPLSSVWPNIRTEKKPASLHAMSRRTNSMPMNFH